MQYFELFNLDEQYNVDIEHLEKQYLLLQRQYHPDNNASTPVEQQEILQFSMLINEAYKILKHPVLRAEYMLNENEYGISDEINRYQLPIEDLQYFLEEQEKIDQCTDIDQLQIKHNELVKKSEITHNNITASWKLRAIEEMQHHSCFLKYLYNLQKYLAHKIDICS